MGFMMRKAVMADSKSQTEKKKKMGKRVQTRDMDKEKKRETWRYIYSNNEGKKEWYNPNYN